MTLQAAAGCEQLQGSCDQVRATGTHPAPHQRRPMPEGQPPLRRRRLVRTPNPGKQSLPRDHVPSGDRGQAVGEPADFRPKHRYQHRRAQTGQRAGPRARSQRAHGHRQARRLRQEQRGGDLGQRPARPPRAHQNAPGPDDHHPASRAGRPSPSSATRRRNIRASTALAGTRPERASLRVPIV